MQSSRIHILVGSILALLGVLLGAWGAHGLEQVIGVEAARTSAWPTAVAYQMYHAIGLLFMGLWSIVLPMRNYADNDLQRMQRLLFIAGITMCAGVILFSGSIYALTLDGPRGLGPVTPLGGSLLIFSWFLLIVVAYQSETRARRKD